MQCDDCSMQADNAVVYVTILHEPNSYWKETFLYHVQRNETQCDGRVEWFVSAVGIEINTVHQRLGQTELACIYQEHPKKAAYLRNVQILKNDFEATSACHEFPDNVVKANAGIAICVGKAWKCILMQTVISHRIQRKHINQSRDVLLRLEAETGKLDGSPILWNVLTFLKKKPFTSLRSVDDIVHHSLYSWHINCLITFRYTSC